MDISLTPSSHRGRSAWDSISIDTDSDGEEDGADEVGDDDYTHPIREEQFTPPPLLSQSVRGSSASSRQPLEVPTFCTPSRDMSRRKRRRDEDDDDDISVQMEQMRADRVNNRAQSLQMYAETNRRMDQLHDFLVASNQSQKDFQQALLNQMRGAFPIASVLPAPSVGALMIQAPPSGSVHSGEPSSADLTDVSLTQAPPTPASTPACRLEEIAPHPPLPRGEPCPETPPPPLVLEVSSDVQPVVADFVTVVDTGSSPVEPAVAETKSDANEGNVPTEPAHIVESSAPSPAENAPAVFSD